MATMTANIGGFRFVWHGGEYCDISRPGGEPFDCLNLWDYEAGGPRITTRAELQAEARAWIREYSHDYVVNGY